MTTPLTLQLKRHISADRPRVWRAWTDPAELVRWYWPASFEASYSVELRVGGRFRYASAAAGMAASGEFAAVDAPSRLVHTWRWDGEDVETLVTVEFLDGADGGTDVVVTHERFTDATECANHAQGWNDCMARLISYDFSAADR